MRNRENFYKIDKKIFLLSAVLLDDLTFKLTYAINLNSDSFEYKGLFIDNIKSKNIDFFNLLSFKSFNKWYKADFGYGSELLCIYYAKRKINL